MVIGCIGDSITHGGHHGYVELLQEYFDQNYAAMEVTVSNWGKSSETITGLTETGHPGPRPYLFDRLDGLLDNNKIDIAVFCYGINCGIYGNPSPGLFDKYSNGLQLILKKMGDRGLGTILLTPPPLALKAAPIAIDLYKEFTWLNPNPDYDAQVLQEFKKMVLNTGHPSILAKIDIHTPLSMKQLECYDKDPIHPNLIGHRLIRRTIVENLAI